MDRLRTAAGALVGVLIGVSAGIAFRSTVVGFLTAGCSIVLFTPVFNTHKREK